MTHQIPSENRIYVLEEAKKDLKGNYYILLSRDWLPIGFTGFKGWQISSAPVLEDKGYRYKIRNNDIARLCNLKPGDIFNSKAVFNLN